VSGTEDAIELPDALPVLPLRETVPFPDALTPLAVGQERSIKLVDDALSGNRLLVMAASIDPEVEAPGEDGVHRVGVVGQIARMMKMPDGSLRLLVQGGPRVRLGNFVTEQPYLVAEIEELPDSRVRETAELAALVRAVQGTFAEIVEEVPDLPEELQIAVANIDDPSALANLIAGALRLKQSEKQELLEEQDVARRLRRLSELLAKELDVAALGSKIQSQVRSEVDRTQREFYLREQLKAIREELGEVDDATAEADELRGRLDALPLPEEVREAANRELGRLERLPPGAPEHGVIRNYLDWIGSMPWGVRTEDNLDLAHARKVLDSDHSGLDQVKDRILEYLAVRSLKPDARGTILCFAGPPGVGKTSLGRSIASSLGREFQRISMGGVRDESEIRGHRRTYIGAMPGTFIRAMRDAGSMNPLLLIDEMDKMGTDFRGDPASAMLEVLDPEQNSTFRDHFLDLPFDLSDVIFVCTANTLDTIPGPLRDRMEIIQLAGYTEEEKLDIASKYLVPRQISRNGLKRSQISFTKAAIRAIVADHTREAGVRNLERVIGSVCRKVARMVAEGKLKSRYSVTPEAVTKLLGPARFQAEQARRGAGPGVATGLAWTPVGGDILAVEAGAMPGTGRVTVTGQLGDVMKESAQTAISWVRSHLAEIAPHAAEDWFATHDLHLHVPAGAIPKDGPSAGITIASALCSLVSGRSVRDDTAMTGEITLTGLVLPIGGLKEKALAAQRAGITRVIAPGLNRNDISEIPPALRKRVKFIFVDHIDDVLKAALEPVTPSASRSRAKAQDGYSEKHRPAQRKRPVKTTGKRTPA